MDRDLLQEVLERLLEYSDHLNATRSGTGGADLRLLELIRRVEDEVEHTRTDSERRLQQARDRFLLSQIDLHAKIARGE